MVRPDRNGYILAIVVTTVAALCVGAGAAILYKVISGDPRGELALYAGGIGVSVDVFTVAVTVFSTWSVYAGLGLFRMVWETLTERPSGRGFSTPKGERR